MRIAISSPSEATVAKTADELILWIPFDTIVMANPAASGTTKNATAPIAWVPGMRDR